MRCVSCKSENLVGHVRAEIMLPLKQKGGSVNTAGHTVTQKTVEEWWQRDPSTGNDRTMLGPVFCMECSAEHTYFKGLIPALRAVPYEDALRHGYNHYAGSAPAKASADEE